MKTTRRGFLRGLGNVLLGTGAATVVGVTALSAQRAVPFSYSTEQLYVYPAGGFAISPTATEILERQKEMQERITKAFMVPVHLS